MSVFTLNFTADELGNVQTALENYITKLQRDGAEPDEIESAENALAEVEAAARKIIAR